MPAHDPYSADSSAPSAGKETPVKLENAVHEPEVHTPNGGLEQPGQTMPATPTPEAEAPKSDSGVPQGTSKEVLAWVGDDKDRAEAALAEEKKSAQPRKGLVGDLEEIKSK